MATPLKQQDVIAYSEYVSLKFGYITEQLTRIELAISEGLKNALIDKRDVEKRLTEIEGVVRILKWAFGILTFFVIGLLLKALENWIW